MSGIASTSKKRKLERDIKTGLVNPLFEDRRNDDFLNAMSQWDDLAPLEYKALPDLEKEQLLNKIEVLESKLSNMEIGQKAKNKINPCREVFSQNNNDIYKWGLKFSGEGSVLDFIESCEDRLRSRRANSDVLTQSFTELLTGAALKWFRSVRTDDMTWSVLKIKLVERFEPINYQIKLDSQIRNFKQTSNQNIQEFVTEIRGLNILLKEPIGETMLLEILKINVADRYKPILGSQILTTIEDLVKYAKNFEQYLDKETAFKPIRQEVKGFFQNKKMVSAIEERSRANENINNRGGFTSTRGRGRGSRNGSFNTGGPRYPVASVSGNPNNTTCLKCQEVGHHYRYCPNIQGKICFGCRIQGVTKKECTGCTRNRDSNNANRAIEDNHNRDTENNSKLQSIREN